MELPGQHLLPFPHGTRGRALDRWPIHFRSVNAKDFGMAVVGKLAKGAMVEMFAVIGA